MSALTLQVRPSLPTARGRGLFGSVPMPSTEATLWIRELLCKAGCAPSEVEGMTSHGLKATLPFLDK